MSMLVCDWCEDEGDLIEVPLNGGVKGHFHQECIDYLNKHPECWPGQEA